MKIYKWVPISNSEKKKVSSVNKSDKENSQKGTPTPPQITPYAGLTAEDSNTCESKHTN